MSEQNAEPPTEAVPEENVVVEEKKEEKPADKKDPFKPGWFSKLAVWAAFILTFVSTTLLAVYTCTWLGEYQYNVQIARHVCILLWIFSLTMCYQFPTMMNAYYMFPKKLTTSFFLVGLVYILTVMLLLADPRLDLLHKGTKGVHYTTTQGTRTLPKLDPQTLFKGTIGMYSGLGFIGAGFWTAMIWRWVSDADKPA